jgi:hypothetical protein
MPFDSRGLDDYVDVAQRIADFRARYPEGSLQPLNPKAPFEIRKVEGVTKDGHDAANTLVIYVAAAYRTPDDKRPGIGMAWEVFPGRTSFTLGSELMNAETSAWGRAIIAALASDSKRGVASREETRNRAAERGDEPQDRPPEPTKQARGADMWDEIRAEERPGSADPGDLQAIKRAYHKLGFDLSADALRMLHVSEQLAGRALSGPHKGKTHKNLSWPEAKKLRADLEGFKGDRGQLMERLTGVTQAAAADKAQDAAEGSQDEEGKVAGE